MPGRQINEMNINPNKQKRSKTKLTLVLIEIDLEVLRLIRVIRFDRSAVRASQIDTANKKDAEDVESSEMDADDLRRLIYNPNLEKKTLLFWSLFYL